MRIYTKAYSPLLPLVPEIKELLAQHRFNDLKKIFVDFEPADIAEPLSKLDLKEKATLFSLWDIDFATDVFELMEIEDQIALLNAVDKSTRIEILDELSPDDRVDLFEVLPEEMVSRFLSIMDKKEAKETEELLKYESDTAGGRMTPEFAWIRDVATVGQTLKTLRKTAKNLETIYYIYVLDKYDRLSGVVTLKQLVLADPRTRIKKIMHRNPVTVPVDMDQEQVAKEISKYDFISLPVVDYIGRMKGIITFDDLMDVMKEEDTEDMYKFGAAGKPPDDYLASNPLSIVKHRMIWLFVLIMLGFVTGTVMELYSGILAKFVALAVFIPLLMEVGGNAGTQATTVVVRGLATGEVKLKDIWKVVKKEFAIGIILGIGLGALSLMRAVFFQKEPLFWATVGLTTIATVVVSTTIGSVLPLLCKKLGFDPAVMSGPLITTIVDITSLVIYFEIASHLLI